MTQEMYRLLEFLSEVFTLMFGMVAVFGCKLKRIWLLGATIVSMTCFVYVGQCKEVVLNGLQVLHLFTPLIFCVQVPPTKDRKWKAAVIVALMYLEELINIVLGDIVYYGWSIMNKNDALLLSSALTILVIAIMAVIRKKYKSRLESPAFHEKMRKILVPTIWIIAFELGFIVSCFNMFVGEQTDQTGKIAGMVFCIISMLGIGVLMIVVYYVRNMNDEMGKLLLAERQMKQVQLEYYETLLEKEEATRRYRHDINGHLICLNSFIHKQDMAGAEEYIKTIQKQLQDIKNRNFNTGVKSIDALLNYYIGQLDESVKVDIKGRCVQQIAVDEVDMSVIFSNLLHNAVEALQQVDTPEKRIAFVMETGQKFVKVELKNTVNPKKLKLDDAGNFVTTKTDAKNHGIGLSNVKKTLSKYRGSLECTVKEEEFCASVILPLRSENDR